MMTTLLYRETAPSTMHELHAKHAKHEICAQQRWSGT